MFKRPIITKSLLLFGLLPAFISILSRFAFTYGLDVAKIDQNFVDGSIATCIFFLIIGYLLGLKAAKKNAEID